MLPHARYQLQNQTKYADMKIRYIVLVAILLSAFFVSCRTDDEIVPSTPIVITDSVETDSIVGFYLLNEGNMGSNKATIDYFDYKTGTYHKNIYAESNPGVVQELGDVGNDIQIYGNKLYAVINCSHFVEVMDVATAEHISTITIPNCRYITFKDQFAYISSYAGPVQIDPNARLGYIAKVDTATGIILDTCVVGYQPEEMVIVGNKLYVANSGGYRVPNYDSTVSVVDLNTFREIKKINVAINLHRLELDNYGNIYVSSRGDLYYKPSRTFIIDSDLDEVVAEIPNLANSDMALCGDSLYVYCNGETYINGPTASYAIVNTQTQEIVTRSFITDGTDANICNPHGIAVNPKTKEIFVTDAKTYVIPGKLHCYSPQGVLKWSVTTGDIPAHFAFRKK